MWWEQALNQLKLSYRLLQDERIPLWTKLVPAAALLYILSPIDLIPDMIPVLGLVDDVALVMGALRLFETLSPDYVVAEHRAALGLPYEPN